MKLKLLHTAVKRGDLATIRCFPKQILDRLYYDRTAVHTAAEKGCLKVMKELATLGCNLNAETRAKYTPLHLAVYSNRVKMAKLLLRLGVRTDVMDDYERTPLGAAVLCNNVVMVKLLRHAKRSRMIVNWIVYGNLIHMLDLLAPLTVEELDYVNRGRTPLCESAEKGDAQMIAKLLQLGSRAIDTPNKWGHTPLMIAVYYGHEEVVELLLRSGLSSVGGSKGIDSVNKYGNTLLMDAVSQGRKDIVKLLLEAGSKAIHTPNNGGNTPIFKAVDRCSADIIEMLLIFGGMPIDNPRTEPVGVASIIPLDKAVSMWILTRDSKWVNLINVLLAVGFDHTNREYDEHINAIRTFSEEEVLETRYRVFFGRSLCNQLLYWID
jgi:ankyrin repeat protein